TDCNATDPTLVSLQHLFAVGRLHRHLVIERDGIRFGILGVLGAEATLYTAGKGAVTFADAVATATEIVAHLRNVENVDVVIALSHGGVEENADGSYTAGDDVALAERVPGIDIVVGGHSHTKLMKPIIVNGRTPVVQSGRYGRNLGELRITMEDGHLTVDSFILNRVDSSVLGDPNITAEIERFKVITSEAVFASRGYTVDQPLVVISQDMPNTMTDDVAMTPLANLVTDAARAATGADVALSGNGMMREGLLKGNSGIQTVYDVFSVAPLGNGIVDSVAGSALVTAYFTGRELKDLLEFLLVENPTHPGEFFPRTSGMRFRYDRSRPKFDVVTAIELGDFDSGYQPIDIVGNSDRLYSLTCPLYLGAIMATVPDRTNGALAFVPKTRDGRPLTTRVDALERPRASTPDLLPPLHTIDTASLATSETGGVVSEIKEWQAVMDHLRRLPVEPGAALPVLVIDGRATEVRAIAEG
ncbi:MAG: hypothetical protein RLZZ623_1771, partial [Actinomycetota bacterium]